MKKLVSLLILLVAVTLPPSKAHAESLDLDRVDDRGDLTDDGTARRPLPFQPLSTGEINTAIAISLKDVRVHRELPKGSRFRVVVVQLHEEELKGSEQQSSALAETPRRGDVVFYRYDNDVTLNLLVDLGKKTVELFKRHTEAQPPLLLEEDTEALEIALKDIKVLERLAHQKVSREEILASGFLFRERAPCLTHRCVMLSLGTADRPLTAFFPVVDLSARRVDHIKTFQIIE